MSFATTAAAIPAALVLPIPAADCWPYLVLSAVLQVGYSTFLASAYREGELSQVYPIIRGSVPLLVTLAGFLLAHQTLSHTGLTGTAMVSLGILSLALGPTRPSSTALAMALATSVFVASYVTADGIGVRVAGNVQSYTAWILLSYGVLMPATFLVLRHHITFTRENRETVKALGAGLLSLGSYGAVLTALSLGKLGPVSALRETSVVFSALLGRMILGERLSARRLMACVAVALGAACLGYDA